MDAHWITTIAGLAGILVSVGIAWGKLSGRINHLETKLGKCEDHGFVDTETCKQCKSEMQAKIDSVCVDLKSDQRELHKYMTSTQERLGKIDGIISRHDLRREL